MKFRPNFNRMHPMMELGISETIYRDMYYR